MFIFRNLFLQVFQHLFGERAVFDQALTRPEVRRLVQRGNAERRRHVAYQIPHFVVRGLRAFIETALRERQGVARTLLMTHDVVAAFEEVVNDFEALIQFRPERFTPMFGILVLHDAQNERDVKRYRPDVAAADRNVPTLFVRPGRQIRTAPHGRGDDARLLVELAHGAELRRERQIVRVHAFGGRLHRRIKKRRTFRIRLDLRLVIEIHELREHHRVVARPVTVAARRENRLVDQTHPLTVFRGPIDSPLTESERRKGKVTAGAGHRIEL